MTCHCYLKKTNKTKQHFKVNSATSISTLTSLVKGRREGRYVDRKSCCNYELQEACWRKNLSSSPAIAEYWMEVGEARGWSQGENWKWRQLLFSLAAGPPALPESIRVDRISAAATTTTSGAGRYDCSKRHDHTGRSRRRWNNISQVVGALQKEEEVQRFWWWSNSYHEHSLAVLIW